MAALATVVAVVPAPVGPRVAAVRPEALAEARQLAQRGAPTVAPALAKLRREADRMLGEPNVAVTDKRGELAPSKDPHDYFSLSPYWWPDSTKPGGLPYVRRDGVTNPESKKDLDQPRVAEMGKRVQTMALAYYLTGEPRYATGAAAQLRAWFLDPATRMTPHLRYAQLVRGIDAERGSGIVDTRWFIEAADAAAMLDGAAAWRAEDAAGLRAWFGQYLAWLRTSPNGRHEHDARNNHGSWYAAQTAALALFTGDTAGARATIADAKPRIGWQITSAGEQPLELERTRSMHYSNFNVEALSRLAEMGRRVGVDLWNYQAPEGGSLRKATTHIARYAGSPDQWPGQQIDATSTSELSLTLRRARTAWDDPAFATSLGTLGAEAARDRSALFYPDAVR